MRSSLPPCFWLIMLALQTKSQAELLPFLCHDSWSLQDFQNVSGVIWFLVSPLNMSLRTFTILGNLPCLSCVYSLCLSREIHKILTCVILEFCLDGIYSPGILHIWQAGCSEEGPNKVFHPFSGFCGLSWFQCSSSWIVAVSLSFCYSVPNGDKLVKPNRRNKYF